jgi:hypothetical protein
LGKVELAVHPEQWAPMWAGIVESVMVAVGAAMQPLAQQEDFQVGAEAEAVPPMRVAQEAEA